MQTILALILIVILGYVGAYLLFYESKLPLGTRYTLFAGSEFLFLGLILGSSSLAILTPANLKLLSPAVNLGLGWIGLLFGIQFELKQLRRMPLSFMGITLTQAVVTFLIAWGGLKLFFPDLSEVSSLIFAVIASASSPTCLAFVHAQTPLTKETGKLAHYISSLDAVVGLLLFGLARFLFVDGVLNQWWLNLPTYILTAASLTLLFHLLIRFRLSEQELLILTIGLIVFSSGIAETFGLSALLLNFFLGAALINLPSLNHRTLADILHRQEKSIYIIFLVFAGAMWTPLSTNLLILLAYLGLRFLGKLSGGFLAASFSRSPNKLLGFSLLPQGGMGIAIAVDYLQHYPRDFGLGILNVILIATLISQLFGPLAIRNSLGTVGET